jgi:hypothetical protein
MLTNTRTKFVAGVLFPLVHEVPWVVRATVLFQLVAVIALVALIAPYVMLLIFLTFLTVKSRKIYACGARLVAGNGNKRLKRRRKNSS